MNQYLPTRNENKEAQSSKLKAESRGKKFSALSFELPASSFYNQHAFTLLEILIVLFILGLIAAMAWPAMGILNNRERERLSLKQMEIIRRAIVGDPDRFDGYAIRIIGGYVGDMEKWPDLWEAKAEEKPSGGPYSFGWRPSGSFAGKNWKWDYPFRKLTNDPADIDHIGGLETENEGQPKGLWTDDPKGDATEIEDPDKWKGPYLVPPADKKKDDSGHLAETDHQYNNLEPKWHPGPLCETWEDGDYNAALGEYFDQKENFRLLQTAHRLADAWGRAFRFFITADPARPGSTIFWIISEGPDYEGRYPAKGTCAAHTWTVDSNDIMSLAYDENNEFNKDNIVLKIYSHEWEAVFEDINLQKTVETKKKVLGIERSVAGSSVDSSPGGINDGFTGGLCLRPLLFRWEGAAWDNEDAASVSYTKGQPRGLWTRTPNSGDAGDDLSTPSWAHPGIGWHGGYIQAPFGISEKEYLIDAWDREVLFFRDAANNAFMILSRGVDGKFDFYNTDTLPTGAPDGTNDYLEPADFTEAVDVTGYNPNDAGGYNADNIVRIIYKSDRHPGFFTLNRFTVNNAAALITKAALFYDTGLTDIRTAGGGNPEDGSFLAGVWDVGLAPPPLAFNYTDLTPDKIAPGPRYLIFWNDTDSDSVINVGENQYTAIYNIITDNSMEPRTDIIIDTAVDFTPAP